MNGIRMIRKRIVDRKLLDKYHTMPCLICGLFGSDPDHIKTKGSGGDDVPNNIVNLCRRHHSERHAIGWSSFVIKYPKMRIELFRRGWQVVEEFGINKLRRL